MALHTLDIAAFRQQFTAFADETLFPDTRISLAWRSATMFVCPYDNWFVRGDRLQFILELMTAHLLEISTLSEEPGSEGGSGGASVGGLVTSATEGTVSVSFKTPDLDGWLEYELSSTEYGRQILMLLEMITVGGFVVGGAPETAAIRDVGGLFSWALESGLRNG